MDKIDIFNRIPVVIPSLEPDERLLELCKNLRDAQISNIVIVDDGSSQQYRKIFDTAQNEFGCVVLRHNVNMGKGKALKDAFEYLLKNQNEMPGCITADSDGQHAVGDIIKCMQALAENPNSLILGCRDFSAEGIPFKSRYGNRITKTICAFLCGIKVSDTQTGLRGIPADFMEKLLSTDGDRFEFETNMLIETKDSVNIVEVPIETIYDSKDNHSTHFDPIKDSIKIYRIFAKKFLKFVLSSLSSGVIDLVLFSVFCNFLEGKTAIYLALSTVLARVILAIYNYLINYKLVFKSSAKVSKSATGYFALAVMQMSLSALLVTLGVKALSFIPEVAVKAVVDTILFFVSYHFQQKYVFGTKKQ